MQMPYSKSNLPDLVENKFIMLFLFFWGSFTFGKLLRLSNSFDLIHFFFNRSI